MEVIPSQTDTMTDNSVWPDRIPLFALLAANAISMVGNRLTMVAVPWFVLETTGSASKTGLTGFVTTVPLVLTAFFGGALVDRVGFKRMSIISDLASGVTVAMIPLLFHTIGLDFWQLLALVLLGAVLDTPGNTARQGIFPDLVDRAGIRLERANAAMQAIWRLSSFLGPPLAGILIAILGTSNVLWLDAVSFGISALLIGVAIPTIAIMTVAGSARHGPALQHYLSDVLAGLQFIRRDRLILLLEVNSTLGNAIGAALFAVILPVYADQAFGEATALGLMLGGFGGGALFSVLLFGAIGYRLPRRPLFMGALVLAAFPPWILATTPPLSVSVMALVLDGLAVGPYSPIVMTVFHERVPSDLRGRFFGTAIALDNATTPLAILIAGYVLEGLGLVTILVAIAIGELARRTVVLLHPALREIDTAPLANG